MNKQDIIVQDKYNNCLKLNKSTVLEQLKRDRKQYRNCYSFKCSKEQFDKEINIIEGLIKKFTEDDLKVFLDYLPKDINGSIKPKYYPLYSTGIYEEDHWDNYVAPYDLVIMPILYLDKANNTIIESTNEFMITIMLTSYSINNTKSIIAKDLTYQRLESF